MVKVVLTTTDYWSKLYITPSEEWAVVHPLTHENKILRTHIGTHAVEKSVCWFCCHKKFVLCIKLNTESEPASVHTPPRESKQIKTIWEITQESTQVSGELWCNLGIKSSSSAFCKQLASDWISDDISALTPEPHDSESLPDTLSAENCKPFCKLILYVNYFYFRYFTIWVPPLGPERRHAARL